MGDVAAARTALAIPAAAIAQPMPAVVSPLQMLEGPSPLTPAQGDFESARQAQAQVFVDAWIHRGGQAPRGALSNLENALIDEDLARSAFYQQQLNNPDLTAEGRAMLLWDKAKWLALKHRAASDLYGQPLVANWTAELPAIRQQTHDTFEDLTDALLDRIESLPTEQQQTARLALYRQLLIWARAGIYPDADQVFLANGLNDAASQWSEAVGWLPVAAIHSGDVTFSLEPALPAESN